MGSRTIRNKMDDGKKGVQFVKESRFPTKALLFFLFWLPAFGLELALQLSLTLALRIPPAALTLLRGSLALLFLGGWSFLIGHGGYTKPRFTLGGIFLYFGGSILLISALYTGLAARVLPRLGPALAGVFSYTPLKVWGTPLFAYNLPHELLLLFVATFCFLAAWLVGLGIKKGLAGYENL